MAKKNKKKTRPINWSEVLNPVPAPSNPSPVMYLCYKCRKKCRIEGYRLFCNSCHELCKIPEGDSARLK